MKNIQLIKRSEGVSRIYDETGNQKETINNIVYKVMRDDQEIGTVDVRVGNVNVNIYGAGSTIEESVAFAEKMFDSYQ